MGQEQSNFPPSQNSDAITIYEEGSDVPLPSGNSSHNQGSNTLRFTIPSLNNSTLGNNSTGASPLVDLMISAFSGNLGGNNQNSSNWLSSSSNSIVPANSKFSAGQALLGHVCTSFIADFEGQNKITAFLKEGNSMGEVIYKAKEDNEAKINNLRRLPRADRIHTTKFIRLCQSYDPLKSGSLIKFFKAAKKKYQSKLQSTQDLELDFFDNDTSLELSYLVRDGKKEVILRYKYIITKESNMILPKYLTAIQIIYADTEDRSEGDASTDYSDDE